MYIILFFYSCSLLIPLLIKWGYVSYRYKVLVWMLFLWWVVVFDSLMGEELIFTHLSTIPTWFDVCVYVCTTALWYRMILLYISCFKKDLPVKEEDLSFHLWWIFLVVSILQVMLYRVFFLTELIQLYWISLWIVLSAFSYTFLHIIYPIPKKTLFVVLLFWIAANILFVFFPDVYLHICFHAVLNYIAVREWLFPDP